VESDLPLLILFLPPRAFCSDHYFTFAFRPPAAQPPLGPPSARSGQVKTIFTKGIQVRVDKGHLVIQDGIGSYLTTPSGAGSCIAPRNVVLGTFVQAVRRMSLISKRHSEGTEIYGKAFACFNTRNRLRYLDESRCSQSLWSRFSAHSRQQYCGSSPLFWIGSEW
jgi:hypothetical protein